MSATPHKFGNIPTTHQSYQVWDSAKWESCEENFSLKWTRRKKWPH
jgi:hypothetical protein